MNLGIFLCGVVLASDPAPITVDSALLTVAEQAEVPARDSGLLVEITVREGDLVTAGARIARLDDGEAKLAEMKAAIDLKRAQSLAANDIKVRLAKVEIAYAKGELKRANDAAQKLANSVSDAEFDRLRSNVDRATLELEQAQFELDAAKLAVTLIENELQLAQARLRRRHAISPIAGMREWCGNSKAVGRMGRIGAGCRARLVHNEVSRGVFCQIRSSPPVAGGKNCPFQAARSRRTGADICGASHVCEPGSRSAQWTGSRVGRSRKCGRIVAARLDRFAHDKPMIARAPDLPVTARPLSLHRRQDIVAESLIVRERRWWRLKDPIALRFWQLGDEEHFLWSQLENGVSLADLQQRFCQHFAPRRIELPHLHHFLGALHREGLVYSTGVEQSDILLERHDRNRARDRLGWMNLLALRFRGIDPTTLLDWLYPRVAWLLRGWMLFAFALLVLSALLLVVTELEQLRARLPQAASFLLPANMIWLALTLAGVKVCHELGHALVCRHLGGRCHELGIMFLVFTPCLYCNVSDAWLMPSRWNRMAIGAAGLCVELILAAAATWLWWFCEPGLLSTLFLNVMVVCSINTLLFNGNPLLRYDGYFLVSDLLDLPNLRQAGDEWLTRTIGRVLMGMDSTDEQPALRDSPLVVPIYAVAAFIYRWLLTAIVWWVVYRWFKEMRLEAIGWAIVLVSAVLLVGQTAVREWRQYRSAWRDRRVRPGRATISLLVISAAVAAVIFVPFARTMIAPATIRPADAETVYVTLQGTLISAIQPGQQIASGDILARLQNDDLEQEVVRLTGEREILQQQVDSLRKRQVQESGGGVLSAAGQLPTIEQQLTAISNRLAERQLDQEQLTLHAPRTGTVLAMRSPQSDQSESLRSWQGSPLDPRNRGCYLEAGIALCQVATPDRLEATVVVEQSQVDAIEVGQTVEVCLDELSQSYRQGVVRAIAELRSESAPPELIAKQLLPVSHNAGEPRLLGTYYQVSVTLDSGSPVPLGASGYARIHVAPQTLARRIYEAVCASFSW